MKKTQKNLLLYAAITSMAIYLAINIFAHFNYAKLESFFMDDVGLFDTFQYRNFLGYLAHGKDHKFRPVSDAFLYIGYKFIGLHAEYAYLFVLLIGLIVCLLMTFMVVRFFDNVWYGIVFSCLYAVSRFGYYSIGQYFGVMESVTTLFAVFTLFTGVLFLKSDETSVRKNFLVVNLAVVLCVFSHERYLTLYGYLFMIVFLKYFFSRKSIPYYGVAVFSAVAMVLFRKVYLGPLSFQGTGGTNLMETFNVFNILSFAFQGVAQLFGWNVGPAYLVGITTDQALPVVNILPIGILALFVVAWITVLYQAKQTHRYEHLKIGLAIIVFIGVTLLSGCITIRLELRWLYIPYVGFLILLFWLLSEIQFKGTKWYHSAEIGLVILLILSFPIDSYFRTGWKYNYLGDEFVINNSIYNCVIRKYGEELYDRPVIVIEEEDGVVAAKFNTMADLYYRSKDVEVKQYSALGEIPQEVLQQNPVVLYAVEIDNICDVTELVLVNS